MPSRNPGSDLATEEETPVTDVTTGQDQDGVELSAADGQVLQELTERARAGGLRLTGEGGLHKRMKT